MVWRNTTKWLPDLKHQQQDTIFFVWSLVQMRSRANRTRVNGDLNVLFLAFSSVIKLSFSEFLSAFGDVFFTG